MTHFGDTALVLSFLQANTTSNAIPFRIHAVSSLVSSLSGPLRMGFPANGVASALIYLMRRPGGTGGTQKLWVEARAPSFSLRLKACLFVEKERLPTPFETTSSLIHYETTCLRASRLSMKRQFPLGLFNTFSSFLGPAADFRPRHSTFTRLSDDLFYTRPAGSFI